MSWAPPRSSRTRHPRPLDREAGDAADARDQLTALLSLFERVLGPEHPYTLTTRSNLAYWTGKADPGSGSGGD